MNFWIYNFKDIGMIFLKKNIIFKNIAYILVFVGLTIQNLISKTFQKFIILITIIYNFIKYKIRYLQYII